MKNQIRNDYKNWLIGLTCSWCSSHGNYTRLMEYLYSREFIPVYCNDENRAKDGIEMRFRFVESTGIPGYSYRDVYNYLTDGCSMLEMMAALARRCEDHIMGDPDIGDRSGVWFFDMITNMHLDEMSDEHFDISIAEQIVDNVINHNYAPNGDGGLFSINNPNIDMRKAEIWYQMNWHLGEIYDRY